MFSSQGIATVRRLVARALKDTAVMQREVAGFDEYGAPSHELEAVGSVACRVITAGSSNSGDAGMAGERERLVNEYVLVVPHGTALDSDYLVTVRGVRYRVTRVIDQMTDAVDVRAVIVKDDD